MGKLVSGISNMSMLARLYTNTDLLLSVLCGAPDVASYRFQMQSGTTCM